MAQQKKMQRRPSNPLSALKNDLAPVYGTEKTPGKRPVGRPTDYDPSVCDKVIEWGKQGFSKTQMSSELNVTRDTLYVWAKAHKEFSDTLCVAMQHSEAWHEAKAARALDLPSSAFNAALWGKIMSARFPATYRETTRTEHSGPEGSPIPLAVANAPATGESLAEFYKSFMD